MTSSDSEYSSLRKKRNRSRSHDKRGKDKISSRDNRKRKHSDNDRDRKKKRKRSHSSSSSSSSTYKKKSDKRVERRKRKYDNEIDELKGKEIDKRREVEVKRQQDLKAKEAEEKSRQEQLKKMKEKELTEEEKMEQKKKARLAKAKLMLMIETEEEKKIEKNADMDQLNEDFLQKDEAEEVTITTSKVEEPIAESKNTSQKITNNTPDNKIIAEKDMPVSKKQGEKIDVEDDEDPLDAFMKTIEPQSTLQDYQISQMLFNQQLQRRYDEIAEKDGLEEREDNVMMVEDQDMNKIDESKIITFDEIFNKKTSPNSDKQENDEDFHRNFINTLKGIKAPDIDPLYGYAEEKKESIIYQEDANEYLKEDDFDDMEDAWQKMKKMGEKKELKLVNHSEINYEPFRKNLYRESKEISNMTKEDVEKFRKEKGDIKVRGKAVPKPIFSWYQCGLSDRILAVLERKGFSEPFPIQCQSIPCIMSGRDVIGIAETGSGKTLAYVLPMLRHIMDQRALKVYIILTYRMVKAQYR
jgi:ATP-dependent RNA helicase DDX46/PRP5